MAAATVEALTGPTNVTWNPEWTDTRAPTRSVGLTSAVVAGRVTKTARAALASGCPVSARAPGSTETVWNVPASHVVCGAIVTTSPASSHRRSTGVGGSTRRAAATDTVSIGVVNVMATGAVKA